jgi:D-3-phosphoglycerate dehydrogenase
MRTVFVDANQTLGDLADRLSSLWNLDVEVVRRPDVQPPELPALLADADVAMIDHSYFPDDIAARCPKLRHVIFLGTGARSYMNPETLAARGICVHLIPNYGNTAVAEMSIALMWAAARALVRMDAEMRQGRWQRTDGLQLSGKTLGVIGFGGIGSEVARLASFMRVLSWNRTAKQSPGVEFVDLDTLLASSDIVSLHLRLNDETRGFLSAERLSKMRPGAILVNTARGALVDEDAMIARLKSGVLRQAALDVFHEEPVPPTHPLINLPNVTLSAHSGFRTPEASENLINGALTILKALHVNP